MLIHEIPEATRKRFEQAVLREGPNCYEIAAVKLGCSSSQVRSIIKGRCGDMRGTLLHAIKTVYGIPMEDWIPKTTLKKVAVG